MADERPTGAAGLRCPRCRSRLDDRALGPYRRVAGGFEEALPLEPVTHRTGAVVSRCGGCGGHFVEHAALLQIERGCTTKVSRDSIARRAFSETRGPVCCAKCGGETTRREWSIGTLVYVDVCTDFDCRGVWLDEGELEAIGGK